MTNLSHVVLGGNGVTGQETVKALLCQGEKVTSVGRRPSSTHGANSLVADLLNPTDASTALAGADVAYFTVGVPYSTRAWAQQWPILIRNVIDAATEHGTHLVYLDNVYAYGEVGGPMTEQTPLHPTSKKGAIRANAIRVLEAAKVERGLNVTIGRSADFYGPNATTSVVNAMVLAPAAAGKNSTWFFNSTLPHSLTYTPDIGVALALLGTNPVARNQTWHLPTAPALTGAGYVSLATGGRGPKVMSLGTMRIGGLFNTAARETIELAYQFAKPYIFDSSRYETTFNIPPTPTDKGIDATLAAFRQLT